MKSQKDVVVVPPAAATTAEIPRPPGGGAWKWNETTLQWEDCNPKPADPVVDKPTETE